MILADKFTCDVPKSGNVFIECSVPGAGVTEILTMWATVLAVLVSLAIAIFAPIVADKKSKKAADLRKWNESAKLYVDAVRALSKTYPRVPVDVDDQHYSAFNYYVALRILPKDHAFAKAVDDVNVRIEKFLDVWVRKPFILKISPGVLLAGTASMRDLFAKNIQSNLREYCKLIVQWHFQPEEFHPNDLVEQIASISKKLDAEFEFISKDYIETKDEELSEKVRKAKRGL